MGFNPRFDSRSAVRSFGLVALAGLTLAGCAQTPTRSGRSTSNEVGAFTDKKYGKASARVVNDGADVPRGGGAYHVGRPYTIAGKTYYPSEKSASYSVTGTSSWYGEAFHGRRTANGEIYDRRSVSAAHPTMPLPSYARVTNLRNNHSIIVRVNDRGPYHGGRVLDVSEKVAEALEFKHIGTARIKVDYVGRAGLGGSDDRKLLATLRTDGPAALEGYAPSSESLVAVIPPRPSSYLPAKVQAVDEAAFETAKEVAASQAQAPVQPNVSQAPRESIAVVTEPAKPRPTIAPLPPSRPFDLGTIPGAGVPVAAFAPAQRAVAVPASMATSPQTRTSIAATQTIVSPTPAAAPPAATAQAKPLPTSQLSALYFAEPLVISRFALGNPFDALKPQKLAPWRGADSAL